MNTEDDTPAAAVDLADILLAARSTSPVLITALPQDALRIARAIAAEYGCRDRLVVGEPRSVVSRLAEPADAAQRPLMLLLEDIHALAPRQQELLLELMDDRHGTPPRILASTSSRHGLDDDAWATKKHRRALTFDSRRGQWMSRSPRRAGAALMAPDGPPATIHLSGGASGDARDCGLAQTFPSSFGGTVRSSRPGFDPIEEFQKFKRVRTAAGLRTVCPLPGSLVNGRFPGAARYCP